MREISTESQNNFEGETIQYQKFKNIPELHMKVSAEETLFKS